MEMQNGLSKMALLRGVQRVVFILMMGLSMSACSSTSWKEEVLLHDGSKIVVERTVERGGRHEIRQQPPIKEQSLSFTMPTTGERITWKSEFSQDIGLADFLPMLLDLQQGTAYVVADTVGCLAYNKWGRPNPPYVIFKYEGKEWKRIPLQELPAEIKTPNLVFSSPDVEVEESGKRFMSAEMIKAIIKGYPQPEYKTILREALPQARINQMCMEEVTNGKGTWLSIDWFSAEPNREACLKVCARKEFDSQHCPCNAIFKGK